MIEAKPLPLQTSAPTEITWDHWLDDLMLRGNALYREEIITDDKGHTTRKRTPVSFEPRVWDRELKR
jgi:hypothetical protein